MRKLVFAFLATALCITAFDAPRDATATGRVHLGMTKKQIDRLWPPDTHGRPFCTPGNVTCGYVAEGIHIEVGYFPTAEEFDLGQYSNPSAHRYWTFMVGLIPAHSRRTACKTIQKTGGLNGPAYACVYRLGKHQIVVAQYLRPSDPLTQGMVKWNANFDDIAAG